MADRAELEAYLQSRSIDYPAAATDEELQTQVLGVIDTEHARFLESYTPVITRLPAAVGSSPEQPAPPVEASEAAQPAPEAAPASAPEEATPNAEQPHEVDVPADAPAVTGAADDALSTGGPA